MLEFKKVLPHDIHITSSANGGYIVTVGCCITVFNTAIELFGALEDYILDPKEIERRYYNQMQKNINTIAGGEPTC